MYCDVDCCRQHTYDVRVTTSQNHKSQLYKSKETQAVAQWLRLSHDIPRSETSFFLLFHVLCHGTKTKRCLSAVYSWSIDYEK